MLMDDDLAALTTRTVAAAAASAAISMCARLRHHVTIALNRRSDGAIGLMKRLTGLQSVWEQRPSN